MNVGVSRPTSRIWRLTAVFALALIVRLVYNLYIAQHRILDVGDSFYYLSTGRALAKLVRESQSINAFLTQLCAAAQYAPGSFNSFTALGLSDRLLIDGPIYPSYLAAIFLVIGRAQETTALNVHQLAFALINSVTDSLLAVLVAFLGEISFGVVAGILAGVLWCVYIPAVVNTQQCYGEPVVALILAAFMASLLYQSNCSQNRFDDKGKVKPDLLLSLFTGILAGFVMLAKPAFVLLPPLLLALHLIALAFSGRLRGRPYSAASLLLGVMLALTPWLIYTSTVTGAPKLIVNRAPGYNLYIGNYLPTDGWKTCPVVEGIPDSVADARRFIESEAQGHPPQLFSLLLRKTARLWAGVWNDFHLKAFGISYFVQNLGHALVLFLATLGLAIACSGRLRKTRSVAFASAMTMAYAVAFHFIYVLFEPVPRYAFTAMPLVIVLAAGGLSGLGLGLMALGKAERHRTWDRFFQLLSFFLILCAALYANFNAVFLLSFISADANFLRCASALLVFLACAVVGSGCIFVLRRLNFCGPISLFVLLKTSLVAALIAVAGCLSDPAFLERGYELSSGNQALQATMKVPDLGTNLPEQIYLLVDAQARNGKPDISVSINNQEVSTTAFPLYEYTAVAADIPSLINLQSRMMDVDQRTFRQWWVCPVKTSLIRFGGDNEIGLYVKGKAQVKVFFDLNLPVSDPAGGETWDVPSLTTFSWSKGFLTADNRDPRVYENDYFRGVSSPTYFEGLDREYLPGRLRLRLAVPMTSATAADKAAPAQPIITLLTQIPETEVSGKYPISFQSEPHTLATVLAPSSILSIHMETRRKDPSVPATVALAIDYKEGKTYAPVWLPSCIRIGKEWQNFDFQTTLPAKVDDWKVLRTHLMLSPFPSDKLYLHRKEALRDSINIRNLKIEILPPPISGARGALKLI